MKPMTKRPVPPAGPPLTPISKAEVTAAAIMVRAASAAIRTVRCRTVAKGRLHQLNYIRDLPPQPVMEEEPEGLLGEAIAPNASEALLAAFGSCLAVGIHANAVAQGVPIRALELRLEADLNSTTSWGLDNPHPKPIGFEVVGVSVHIDADAPHEVLTALIKHAVLWSPVANTLHNPVHLDVTLAEEAPP
jgi:uncharacterized OsmC-like protein